MKVRELVEILLRMPKDATVVEESKSEYRELHAADIYLSDDREAECQTDDGVTVVGPVVMFRAWG